MSTYAGITSTKRKQRLPARLAAGGSIASRPGYVPPSRGRTGTVRDEVHVRVDVRLVADEARVHASVRRRAAADERDHPVDEHDRDDEIPRARARPGAAARAASGARP